MSSIRTHFRPQAQALNCAGYDELPESIKTIYSPTEYAWLSDLEKARLIETETEPEVD